MSYCGNCFRELHSSSMDCPCRQGTGHKDQVALDKIIRLHRPLPADEYDGSVDCGGCFNEIDAVKVRIDIGRSMGVALRAEIDLTGRTGQP